MGKDRTTSKCLLDRASVSVVIPTFNNGRLLPQAIESVLAQTVRTSEIIVVDDGSTDDTHDRLTPFLGHIKYIRQENQGPSVARNRGVEAASGELIAFLDSDDVWHPLKIEIQLEVMARKPELALVATGTFDWPTTALPRIDDRTDAPVKAVSWSQLVVRTSLLTSSVLVRRHALDCAGPFDSSLKGPEDRDLFLRVAATAPVATIDLPLTGYRNVQGSLSKQVSTCEAGMRAILNRLDEGDAWKGRWLLRRKAYSYMYFTCSYLHGALRYHKTAMVYLMKSFAWYPFPYLRNEVATTLARPKRLVVNALRIMGLKPPETPTHEVAVEVTSDGVVALSEPSTPRVNRTNQQAESSTGSGISISSRRDGLQASNIPG